MIVIAIAFLSRGVVASPWINKPPKPIENVTFVRLVQAMNDEPFTEGRIEQLRAVAGGRRYLFTGAQAIMVLDTVEFWVDRLEALRLVPIADRSGVLKVASYFAPAPALIRSEARRILHADE